MKNTFLVLISLLLIGSAKAEDSIPRYPAPSKEELREQLSPISWKVTQEAATERPFTGALLNEKRKGIFVDITTGEPLFLSTAKFESGCGWPSFTKPVADEVIKEIKDKSLGMVRTEVRSRSGDAHLGHVFDDGPRDQGGLRYCINSASLRFVPYEDMEAEGYGSLKSLLDKQP